jgi:hypothetical protein
MHGPTILEFNDINMKAPGVSTNDYQGKEQVFGTGISKYVSFLEMTHFLVVYIILICFRYWYVKLF